MRKSEKDKVEWLRALGKPILARSGGMYINTWGDAIVAGFADPNDGLSCACKFIQHLTVERIEARIGMSYGTAQVKWNDLRERLDIQGDSINLEARLEPLAETGEVLISEDLRFHEDIDEDLFRFEEVQRSLKKDVGQEKRGRSIQCYSVTL